MWGWRRALPPLWLAVFVANARSLASSLGCDDGCPYCIRVTQEPSAFTNNWNDNTLTLTDERESTVVRQTGWVGGTVSWCFEDGPMCLRVEVGGGSFGYEIGWALEDSFGNTVR